MNERDVSPRDAGRSSGARPPAGAGIRFDRPDGSPTTAPSLFTIVGGTTQPDRALAVRHHCREGSTVELRRCDDARVEVWLGYRAPFWPLKSWVQVGHVPDDAAALLLSKPNSAERVVGHGTVRTVYAPVGRDEAVVTVEIAPRH